MTDSQFKLFSACMLWLPVAVGTTWLNYQYYSGGMKVALYATAISAAFTVLCLGCIAWVCIGVLRARR